MPMPRRGAHMNDTRTGPSTDPSERLQRLYREFSLLSARERQARMALLSASEPELAAGLADAFSQPTRDDAAGPLLQPGLPGMPEEIAGFRVLSVLGRGGMGVVYLAERTMAETVQRVALKVLAGTHLSPQALNHFYAERRILAALNHPHIATLIEAGTAADGSPYLAMEHVDGKPIDAHARSAALDRAGIVRLAISVLSAVSHAHRNLIVHRDLKPGNVLVTADGVPKLLDFGIAKLLDDAPALSTRNRMYTPEYASPEQLLDQPVTTATDIYGFAVVLHELLSGNRPGRSPVGERSIDPALPRDLRRILAHALEVDPQARYASAAALADDLQAHLQGEPLKHAHETARERLVKHVGRHRFGFTAAALTLAAVLAIAANMSLTASRLAQERDRALAAQTSAQQVSEFLVSVFEQADPDTSAGRTITARDLLDAGARRIDGLEHVDPSARAQLLEALGRIYDNLGLVDSSLGLYQRALKAHRQMSELQVSALARLYRRLANAHETKGETDIARKYLDQAQTLLEAHPEMPRRELAILQRARGNHAQQRGDAKGALDLLMTAQQMFEQAGETQTEDLAQVLQLQSGSLLELGKPREALAVLERAYAIRRVELGESHSHTAFTLGQIGRAQRDLGDQAAALTTLSKVMQMRLRMLGPRHPDVGLSANELANLYHDMGNVPEAERYYRMALDIDRGSGRGESASSAFVLNNLAILLESAGRFEEAEPLYRESIVIRRKQAGKDDGLRVVRAEQNYAVLLGKLSRYDEAIPLLENALALRSRELGPEHLDTRITRANLHAMLYQANPSAVRGQASRQSWQVLIDMLGDQPPMRAMFEIRLANLLLDMRQWADAEAAYRLALQTLAGQDSASSINVAMAELGLGLALVASGRSDEGRALVARGRVLAQPTLAPNAALRRELAALDGAVR
jgi:serine/threonine-protein kinase